MDRVEIECSE